MGTMPDAPAAAAPVKKMAPSPALRTMGKMKDTLAGRTIGILIADGSDGAVIKKIKKAAADADANVKIVAPKVAGAKLADGSMLAAAGQLAGTPSVLFDAVAVILSGEDTPTGPGKVRANIGIAMPTWLIIIIIVTATASCLLSLVVRVLTSRGKTVARQIEHRFWVTEAGSGLIHASAQWPEE